MQPVLVIQGGAGRGFGNCADVGTIRKKIARILKLAYQKLLQTDALEAVTYAVKLLEDDPAFNAGTGSQLQADGRARLSASIMDGSRLRFAGVVNLEKIKNPIWVARSLLEEKDRILAGEGAFHYATKVLGLKPKDTRTKDSIKRWKKWETLPLAPSLSPLGRGKNILSSPPQGERTAWTGGGRPPVRAVPSHPLGNKVRGFEAYDTVGACALDRCGRLASATSTGGRGFERPGRVSDSAMPVANYADDRCAISASGIGEEIIDEGLAIKIAVRVQDGMNLQKAFRKTFDEVRLRGRRMGTVGLDSKGNVAHATTTEVLIFGWKKGNRTGSI